LKKEKKKKEKGEKKKKMKAGNASIGYTATL